MILDEYIKTEVERQGSTKFVEFATAYHYALNNEPETVDGWLGLFVQEIAEKVEPSVNGFSLQGDRFCNFRQSEVGFANGGRATKCIEVPHQFDRLVSFRHVSMEIEDVEIWVKTLLEIHPWLDGNGRTASILRNWILRRLNDPEPLPYYFSE